VSVAEVLQTILGMAAIVVPIGYAEWVSRRRRRQVSEMSDLLDAQRAQPVQPETPSGSEPSEGPADRLPSSPVDQRPPPLDPLRNQQEHILREVAQADRRRKLLLLGLSFYLLFFISFRPHSAADIFKSIGAGLIDIVQGFMAFGDALWS
jgi:hypothetical protein